MNPKQLERMLRQMGIKTKEINAKEVVIVLESGEKLVFENPQVVETVVAGQRSYQIIGEPRRVAEKYTEEDVKIVMEKTGTSREEAVRALEKANGDIAQAIMIILESR